MAQYEVEIKYPPQALMPKPEQSAEIHSLVIYADWADDAQTENEFDVTVITDDKRFSIAWDLSGTASRTMIDNLTTLSIPRRRHFAELNAKAGVWGAYASLSLTKKVPKDGAFKWFGFKYRAIPRLVLGAESLYSSGARQNAWA